MTKIVYIQRCQACQEKPPGLGQVLSNINSLRNILSGDMGQTYKYLVE